MISLLMIFKAFSLHSSDELFLLIFQIDSKVWEIQSSTGKRKFSYESVFKNAESSMYSFGKRLGWSTEYFLRFTLSQIVANWVTSAPVPEVVGIAVR